MLRSILVLAVLSALPRAAHAGACARPELPTRALTAPDAELAKGGGVVVAMENAGKAPAMMFASGGTTTAAKKTVIGAGLVVYTPAAGKGPVALQLKGKALVKVKRGGETKALEAPKVGSVRFRSSTGRRGTSVSISVEITGPVPIGAVAVAVFDDKGAIRSWGQTAGPPTDPAAKTTVVGVFASGSCVVQPDGFAPSAISDKVQVAFIDASGRISAKSATTVVAMQNDPSEIQ